MLSTKQSAGTSRGRTATFLPGIAVVVLLTVVATLAGRLVPVAGAPVVAIVAGMLVSLVRPPTARTRPGITMAAKRVLQASVVVLGTGLSLSRVFRTGERSLPVLVGTLVVVILTAWVVGRRLHLRSDLNVLIGVGTAICGASAIAAANTVIEADEADVTYAIATIFTFNVTAVLTFPTVGHALGLSQRAFGLWAGTAINDTSSVVAASTVYGHGAAAYGVVVKLTRTLAIIPVCLALSLWRRRHSPSGGAVSDRDPDRAAPASEISGAARAKGSAFSWRHVVPLFILGFLATVTLNGLGLVPEGWHGGLTILATWMITAALGAIGLSTRFRQIRRAGARPIALGATLWIVVALTSLALQQITGLI